MAAMHAHDDRTRWARELLQWWRHYNRLYAGGALRPPVLRIAAGGARLGAWDPTTRTLSIAEHHIRADAWLGVLETLRHEMAHQYADEVLGAGHEPPHGPAFQRAYELLRVARLPAAAAAAGAGARLVERIHKLIALGESPNEHEAQAALHKARALMIEHNVDALAAPGPRPFAVRWLGPLKGRHALWEQLLAALLSEFFFVSVLWTHSYDPRRDAAGSVLEACGTEENLAMADYVHAYLVALLPSLWQRYRAAHRLRGDGERQRYFAGVISGFAAKMREQDARLRARHALVPQGDPALEAYVRHRHPQLRSGAVGGATASRAFTDGVADGREVTLRKPLADPAPRLRGYLSG